ncbi:hypothetical protein OC846_006815, partial [Tilletia horrida]
MQSPSSLSRSSAVAFFSIFLTGLLFSALLPQAHAAPGINVHSRALRPVQRFSLNVTERIVAADGNPINSVLLNNSLPGPEIRVRVGDRVLINVTNALTDKNTTLHIHGMSQRMTPFSDGTPLVSQWPIAPGNWFEYELIVGIADQGTYFYHSHVD